MVLCIPCYMYIKSCENLCCGFRVTVDFISCDGSHAQTNKQTNLSPLRDRALAPFLGSSPFCTSCMDPDPFSRTLPLSFTHWLSHRPCPKLFSRTQLKLPLYWTHPRPSHRSPSFPNPCPWPQNPGHNSLIMDFGCTHIDTGPTHYSLHTCRFSTHT